MGFVADVLGVGKGPEKAAAAAGDAQVRAAQIGADTIRDQQKQYREDSAPYAQAGQQGLASLLYGLTGQQMGGAALPMAAATGGVSAAPPIAATALGGQDAKSFDMSALIKQNGGGMLGIARAMQALRTGKVQQPQAGQQVGGMGGGMAASGAMAAASPATIPLQAASMMDSKAGGWKGALKNSARLSAGIGQQPAVQPAAQPTQSGVTGTPVGMGAGDLMRSYGYQDFQNSPDYQFRLNRGMEGLESSAAARGGLMSGAALKSLNEFNRGTFDQQFASERANFQGEQANRYGRLFDLARLGQNTVAQTGAQGASAAANIANQQNAAGQAQAGAILAGQNARQDRYSGLAGLAGGALGMFI